MITESNFRFLYALFGFLNGGLNTINLRRRSTLLLEVRINPRDIGFLHPGQKAHVKFTAYDFAVYGGLEGELEQLGADTIIDEKGNAFYIAKVRTEHAYVGEDNRPILPGMVAEVHILTGKRTVLQYLLKPVLRARENAFTER